MGASIGTDDNKSVNVELNIVPYIDLMSCLTAFLLVVAVWVNIAQITIKPKGRQSARDPVIQPPPTISVLMQADTIYVGVAHMAIDPVVLKREAGADHDWARLESALAALRKESDLSAETAIEVAADGGAVSYGDVVHAMDLAVKVGFAGVGLTEPTSLSWRPSV